MPEVSAVHVNTPLTNLAVAYAANNFIAPRLIPDLPVMKKSDSYYIFDSARVRLKQVEDKRAPGTEANLVDFDVTTDSYLCVGYALGAMVPDEERENADPPIRPMMDKTEALVQRVLLNQELDLVAALVAGVSQTSDPTNEWDDYTNGDPVADMHLAINAVEDAIGMRPNVVSMDSKVWRAVRNHPDILERVKYGGGNASPAEVNELAFASLFDLDEVIVGTGLKNTAVSGQATPVISRTWGSDVYVAYRTARPGIGVPSLGYRFVWNAFSGTQQGWLVKSWREEKKSADQVEVQKYYQHKLVMAAAAYRLQNRLT